MIKWFYLTQKWDLKGTNSLGQSGPHVVYYTYTNANTQYKYMYKYRKTLLFRYELFYWLLSSVLRHEERDTILTMLTIPNARRILWCLRSLSVEICKTPTTCLNGRELNSLCPTGRELNCLPAWSNVNSQLTLFQNPQILRTISPGHGVIQAPASFPVWGFIMTMVIVISFARKRKLYQLTMHLNS